MTRVCVGIGLFLSVVAVGCSTSRPLTGLADRFRSSAGEDDELILDRDELSPAFRRAKSELKDAERTMLSWAAWREDAGQYAEARRRYQEILTDNPDCVAARLGIARVERKTGRFRQCLEILEGARARHPDDPAVPLEMGRAYAEREQWDEAIVHLQDAAALNPDDETIQYELGLAFTESGRYEEAIVHLKEAVGEAAALYNIGYVLHESGRSTEAAAWFQQALARHPDARTKQMAEEMLAQLRPQPAAGDALTAQTDSAFVQGGVRPVSEQAFPPHRPAVRPATMTRTAIVRGSHAGDSVSGTANGQVETGRSGVATYNSVGSGGLAPWRGFRQNAGNTWRPTASGDARTSAPPAVSSAPAGTVQEPPAWHRY